MEGKRRGGARDLSAHLRKTDENEVNKVLAIEGFAFSATTPENLDRALMQMEANGYAKGNKRNLFHTKIAPAYGESLTKEQLAETIASYIRKMGFTGYQYVAVEHWKKGKAHYHLVFDIINPATGKIHELKFTRRKEWNIRVDLAEKFNQQPLGAKGKAVKVWEAQRGKRSGIDAVQVTKDATAVYHASKTGAEFVDSLQKAGYMLARTDRGKLVLVDRAGDTHGLLRRLQGVKAVDFRRKFPGMGDMKLPSYEKLIAELRPKAKRKSAAYRGGLQLSSEKKFSRRSEPPRFKLIKPLKSAKQAGQLLVENKKAQERQKPVIAKTEKKGWPEAAIIDWEVWGHRNPPRFFTLWPELAP